MPLSPQMRRKRLYSRLLKMNDKLIIRGAREHNLKDIDLDLPKDSLIVISGLSGSGKSSLAFDTIFAEGQRRYMESLSSYARMFLGRLEKPDVDLIEGLSPAIAIEQKSTNRNPRSTVGTVTEIYDYYRLLWARVGRKRCPRCGREISEMSIDQIMDLIAMHPEDARMQIMAPIARGRKGEYRSVLEEALRSGYLRAEIDGKVYSLEEGIPALEKNIKHTVSILVDRVRNRPSERTRIADAIERCTDLANGLVEIEFPEEGKREIYSEKNGCPDCGFTFPEIEPRFFSFNSPFGACPECNGIGTKRVFSASRLVPDRDADIRHGAIKLFNPRDKGRIQPLLAFLRRSGVDPDTPIGKLPKDIYQGLFYGCPGFKGVIPTLDEEYERMRSFQMRMIYDMYKKDDPCPVCHGNRLRKEALSVYVGGLNIMDATKLSVDSSLYFIDRLQLTETEKAISHDIIKEIRSRLTFLKDVGLGYLTLSRSAATLSGGEAQRIRLATQIGSSLTGVLYVLDEPSIGLHQRDNQRLIDTLLRLRDLGNTVIVVEHDEDTIRSADYLVDLGPGAGELGGHVVAAGTPEEVSRVPESVTGQFLSGAITIPVPQRRKGNGEFITLRGCRKNNLKDIDVKIPLGTFTVITGVSGSGKSTLLNEVFLPAASRKVGSGEVAMEAESDAKVYGLDNIDKVISIDQTPIGRTPRSNPATYVGVFTPIRELFASVPEAKARGYTSSRFSFNVEGGRCENCSGDGQLKIEMHFLPDVYVKCDVCHGRRYNRETLAVTYKGKTIADVLDMTVAEALSFFSAHPKIVRKLQTLMDVGLDYIRLGQSALDLSGGEAQRVKLSLELSKVQTGRTLYVLDEPTTGLHFVDVKKLLEVLQRFVDQGNTVILIEHNLDVIKNADWIIDLGPEGGDDGGRIVAEGTPEEVAATEGSYTGQFLRRYLKK